jgi:hypothetical protein
LDVVFSYKSKNKKIEIYYYTNEDIENIMSILGITV